MLNSSIPFNKLKINKLYKINHREGILESRYAVLVSVNRFKKSYHNSNPKTDAIYLKIFNATFRTINSTECLYVFPEDEWTITESASDMVFNKIIEGGDLDVLPDDVIGKVKNFFLGTYK